MKLKKKIMLVVSMAIMTLSTVLSSMQVYAANSNYNYVSFGTKSDYIYDREICSIKFVETGLAVSTDGSVYYYPKSDTYQVQVKAHMPIKLENYTSNSQSYIQFSENTTGFGWDFDCTLNWTWKEYFNSNSLMFNGNMALQDLTMSVYGKEYDIPFDSSYGTSVGGSFASVNLKALLYCLDIPETKWLSTKDLSLEATFIVNFTVVDYDYTSSSTIVPICNYTMRGLYFYELYGEDIGLLKSILDSLTEIKNLTSDQKALMQTYYPKLNQLYVLMSNNISPNIAEILSLTEDALSELESIDLKMDTNNAELKTLNSRMVQVHNELIALHTTLKNQSSADKNATDGFKQDSDSQSSELNNLNQQTQVDKIDVDNASGTVDDNLNVEVDSNYGVLLSTFTSNNKILTMLLAVSSMGLISYVLFGKR